MWEKALNCLVQLMLGYKNLLNSYLQGFLQRLGLSYFTVFAFLNEIERSVWKEKDWWQTAKSFFRDI